MAERSPPTPHADAPPARSYQKVFVFNKLPRGLTVYLEEQGPAKIGSVDPIMQMREETKVFLNGINSTRKITDQNPLITFGAFGITEVDAEFWEEWASKHKNFAPFKNGMIGAAPTRERANAMALERKAEFTGFEPIDPANPGRGVDQKGIKIETRTE